MMFRGSTVSILNSVRRITRVPTNFDAALIRNENEDHKRVLHLLKALNYADYGLDLPSMNSLVKCLYVTVPFMIDFGPGKRLKQHQLNELGRKILKDEYTEARKLFDSTKMLHLSGLQKDFMQNQKYGVITMKFLEMKGLSKLARLPIPNNRLPKKALIQQDLKAVQSMIALLAQANGKERIMQFIQNEIIRPSLRHLFRK